MYLANRTWDDIAPGETAELRRLVTPDDLFAFAANSGNFNPMHLPGEDGDGDGVTDNFVHGMFTASLVSAVIGTLLPGPGTLLKGFSFQIDAPAYSGDELVSRVTVTARNDDGTVTLAANVTRPSDGATILTGEARVQAPVRPYARDGIEVPGLVVQRHRHFEAILARARPLPPLRTAVVCPETESGLDGPLRAARESLIYPILVGDPARISAVAAMLGIDIDDVERVPAIGGEAAARAACALVREGRADAVMKGHLHTDDLMRALVDRDTGLRTQRRMTHVFVIDVPGLPHPLMVTDAAINIAPDLATKADIVQNAIDLAISLGTDAPRVGVLSAVETVNPAIQSSIDGALLSKMAERGQIKGGYVDGPLAMDNAVNMAAARLKGLRGEVAGHANILVVPGIDAGNMLAKQLAFLSHAEGAGIVLGARVPVILNSRSDSAVSRLASCAVAAIHHYRLGGQPT